MKLKLHSGKQYLVLNGEGLIIESVTFNIYAHAYRLASDDAPLQCSQADILTAVKLRLHSATSLVECKIIGNASIMLPLMLPIDECFSVARADGRPLPPSNF